MAQMTRADLRRVLRFLGAAIAGTSREPFPLPTLAALQELIGADGACYFELRRADRAVLAYTTTPEAPEAPGSEEALVRFRHQNPISWRRWHPANGALRFSGVLSRRERERLEFYQHCMRPNGVQDSLKVWLWSSAESAACVMLDRAESDFSRREQDLLAILQHDLIQMRAQALAGWASPPEDGPALTAREAEVLLWAARGRSDDVIADMLGTASATVGKHLEHAYDKLGVRSRAEALALLTLSHGAE